MRYFANVKTEKRIREITNKINNYPFSDDYESDRIKYKELSNELDTLLDKRKPVNKY